MVRARSVDDRFAIRCRKLWWAVSGLGLGGLKALKSERLED